MPPIRIAIADDHTVLRTGLRLLLDSQSDFHVVAEASDGKSTLAVFEDHLPDVMIVDLAMPGVEGFELLRELKKRAPHVRLVVLTMHDGQAYFQAAIAAGADAFVPKNAADGELMVAIRSVETGKFYGNINKNEPRVHADATEDCRVASETLRSLSERERDVLIGVGRGLTNQQMANEMRLSVKSIESYRSRLMLKLGVSTRSELVKIAIELGLLFANRASLPEDGKS